MSNIKRFFGACLIVLLSACSSVTVEPVVPYSKTEKLHLYKLSRWSIEGRLSVNAKKDSWSANINWQHTVDNDSIKLSGPLGQGAMLIKLNNGVVTIDRGDGRVQSSSNPEQFIQTQLGMFVPIQSLRYWIIGLPEPTQLAKEIEDGFYQSGWLISYPETQSVEKEVMPKKITVLNDKLKLKLIIDSWNLNGF